MVACGWEAARRTRGMRRPRTGNHDSDRRARDSAEAAPRTNRVDVADMRGLLGRSKEVHPRCASGARGSPGRTGACVNARNPSPQTAVFVTASRHTSQSDQQHKETSA